MRRTRGDAFWLTVVVAAVGAAVVVALWQTP